MTDSNATERLSAYIDGELSSAEMAEVDKALREDPVLRGQYEELLAAVDFVREHGPLDAPVGFATRVIARAEELPMPGGWWRRLLAPFQGIPIEGLAVALAGLLVVYVVARDPEPASPAAPEVADVQPTASLQAPPAPAAEAADVKPDVAPEAAPRAEQPAVVAEAAPNQDGDRIVEELMGVGGASEDGVAFLAEPGAPTGGGAEASVSGEVVGALNATVAYSVRVPDNRALFTLDQLVRSHGGALLDASTGAPLDLRRLGQSGERLKVRVMVPPERLGAFARALEGIGQVTSIGHRDAELLGGGKAAEVWLELSYQP